MFEKGLLKGKRILITGGGSGLGAAMGRRFAELGGELIICGRRLELLEQTASAMRNDFGATVSVARCDIRDGGAVDAMMDQLFASAPIDVLVNSAAATFIAQSEHLSVKQIKFAMNLARHGKVPPPFPPHVAKDVAEARALHDLVRQQGRAGAAGIVQGEKAIARIEFAEDGEPGE